jgi:hypothetical protein
MKAALEKWLFSYLGYLLRGRSHPKARPLDIIFCIADHFEPRRGGVSKETEVSRVKKWVEGYAEAVFRHRDASADPSIYLLYPYDEYTPEVLERRRPVPRGWASRNIFTTEIHRRA